MDGCVGEWVCRWVVYRWMGGCVGEWVGGVQVGEWMVV